jgi:hypothetical protein
MLDALMLLAQAAPFPTTPTAPPPGPPPVFVFGVIAIAFLIIEAIWAGICYMLYITLKAVPPEHQKMPPGQIWLLLIPLFNLGWNFLVFQRIPESYQSFFYSRGRTDVGDGGKQIGLWYSICAVCGIVPCLNYIAGPGRASAADRLPHQGHVPARPGAASRRDVLHRLGAGRIPRRRVSAAAVSPARPAHVPAAASAADAGLRRKRLCQSGNRPEPTSNPPASLTVAPPVAESGDSS